MWPSKEASRLLLTQGKVLFSPSFLIKYNSTVLLWGQIADGLATPLVGVFSDKTNSRLGKRTPW